MSQFIDFPPFYTLQLNAATRSKQFGLWADLLREKHSDFVLELSSSSKPPIFVNKALGRELDPDFIRALCTNMIDNGLGEWLTVNARFLLYKRPIVDWAAAIHAWANKTGKINSIESAFSVIHGDESKGEAFHEIPNEIALHALRALEAQGKCELIFRSPQAASDIMACGVKFFS